VTVLPGQKFSYLTVTARWSGGRWVCRCEGGGETIAKAADLKHGKVRSCGCDSAAHMEELLAKREATRQRVARHRKKANKNNDRVTRYMGAENIGENERTDRELYDFAVNCIEHMSPWPR
jgi:hypothetical protein